MGRKKKTSGQPLKRLEATPNVSGYTETADSANGGKGKSSVDDAGKVFDKKPAYRYLNLDDVSPWWGFFLFGYFPNRFPGEAPLLRLCNSWNVKYLYHPHSSGLLVFGFENEQDRDTVLKRGPNYVYGKFLGLRILPRCFEFGYKGVNVMPLWINLPCLPLECWNESAILKISSEVGKPLCTDGYTKTREKMSYAKVLVEVDVAKELVRSVPMTVSNGKTHVQEVIYEFETKFCASCKMFGHLSVACGLQNHQPEPSCSTAVPLDEPRNHDETTYQQVQHLADKVASFTVESRKKKSMNEQSNHCSNSSSETMVDGLKDETMVKKSKGKLVIKSGGQKQKQKRLGVHTPDDS